MKRLILATLVLTSALAAARAEDEAPKPEPGVTAQSACIKQDSEWTRNGKRIAFTISLSNQCSARLRCRVFAYTTSAKGAAQGQGTLILKPGAKGQETKAIWSMRVKMAGGSAQTTRECRAL